MPLPKTPQSRIQIQAVEPLLDCGRYPVKRTVGDDVEVYATVLKDGHDTLAGAVRDRRANLGFSQSELARRLGSSQSRVAKIEAGESNVSFDLLVRAMLATGAKPREVGAAIAAG